MGKLFYSPVSNKIYLLFFDTNFNYIETGDTINFIFAKKNTPVEFLNKLAYLGKL